MSKYGETAILAVELVESGEAADPDDGWERAARQIFPASQSLRDKGCPKGAFIGLCREGLVKGVDAGTYGRPSKNGKYAQDAARVLSENRFLCSQPNLLWKKVAGPSKTENHQMDVVIALWQAGRIRT